MAPEIDRNDALTQPAPDNRLDNLKACLQAVSLYGIDGEGPHSLASWVTEFVQSLERQARAAAPVSEAQVCELQAILTTLAENLLATAARTAASSSVQMESVTRNTATGIPAAGPFIPSIDPTTGLPGRDDAKAAIAARIKSEPGCAIALFIVDRLAFLNAKFGRNAGDEVLVTAARHIMQTLPTGASVFRWNGPAFAALLEIPHGLTAVEHHVKKAANSRLEQTVEAGGRSVMLPISRSYHLRRLDPSESADSVFRSLDDFIAGRSLDASRAS